MSYTRCGYKTASGRVKWPNRDPMGEEGGYSLYNFVLNNPVYFFDAEGLRIYFPCPQCGLSRPAGFQCECENRPIDQANAQFDEALAEWMHGGSGSYYGPDDPWTKELAKLPTYSRMRNRIREKARDACKNGLKGSQSTFVNNTFKWNYTADESPITGPIRDGFVMLFGDGLKSTGSTRGEYVITSLSCCPSEVCFSITVTDAFRLGSATRIPGSSLLGASWSVLPDIPAVQMPGPYFNFHIPFQTYQLSWRWSECLSFVF